MEVHRDAFPFSDLDDDNLMCAVDDKHESFPDSEFLNLSFSAPVGSDVCANVLSDFTSDINLCKYLTLDEVSQFSSIPTEFSVLQLNARSLPKNFMHISSFVKSFKNIPSIMAVVETWLSNDMNSFYNMKGYKFISRCRSNKRGGGVGFYVADYLNFTVNDESVSVLDNVCEATMVEISNCNGSNIIIVCMYRPPGTNLDLFCGKLSEFLTSVFKQHAKKNYYNR